MKSVENVLREIRRLEGELVYATPAQAAKLTTKLVRLKATVFD